LSGFGLCLWWRVGEVEVLVEDDGGGGARQAGADFRWGVTEAIMAGIGFMVGGRTCDVLCITLK